MYRGPVVSVLAAMVATSMAVKPPHIVFIVSDDLGYNDVSFHGSTQIPTPRLDALAHSGVILSHYFVQPVCSPTRATFATGRHVIHTGVYDPMNGGSGVLSRNFSLWSNGFKALGYSTHAVGKWHIGMSSWRFTPLERGFDTYYGYLGGGENYWTHVDGPAIELFDGKNPVTNASCTSYGSNINTCPVQYYSADLFTERACDIITTVAAQGDPLFLYLAYQSVHSPDQAPQYLIDKFNGTIANAHRQTFAGMVAALDLGVGQVVDTLTSAGIFDDTLLVFSTDNGGPADGFNSNMACNWPLRGMKRTLFEGGVRGVGFVRGVGIQSPGRVANGYVHAADWFHTLLRVGLFGANGSAPAGGSAAAIRGLLPASEPPFEQGDGMDVWDYLRGAAPQSPRTEVLHEAHPQGSTEGNGAALRVGDLKVVIKTGSSWSRGSGIGTNDGWYGGPQSSDNVSGSYCINPADVPHLSVTCGPPPKDLVDGFPCEKNNSLPCLFNVTADPCEQVDLSAALPDQLAAILARLAVYQQAAVPTNVTANPDGGKCPYVAEVNGVKAWVPCENNGSRPLPPGPPGPGPSPPPGPAPGPPPPDAFELEHGGQCLTDSLSLSSCTNIDNGGSKIWYNRPDGNVKNALMADKSCLKVFENEAEQGGCSSWTELHLGVCRQDNNSMSLVGDEIVSNMCPGKCAAASTNGNLRLSDCSGSGVTGWSVGSPL
eukprot:m.44021 g.44021  ORF g.44021 m.44021 type:complete len:713 (-) comp6481_c0_seq1:101-2239(-)